ncbi:MAG: hypothetical protein K5853_01740 [Lachnospiraceae bacterium]|nr:hypothetical protein [Lachnospiraceae bacterium]
MKPYQNKKPVVLALLLLIATLCSACGPADGPVPSKRKVMAHVRELCDEKVELISEEEVCESPREVVYTFQSKQRELTFTVRSYRAPVGIPTSEAIIGYQKKIGDDYVKQVFAYYHDAIAPLFDKYTYEGSGYLIEDTDMIEAIAQDICEANAIYREELNYNRQEFLDAHPFYRMNLCVRDTDDGTIWIGRKSITGNEDTVEEITRDLREQVAQKIVDGKVSAETYSGLDSEIATRHVSKLTHIYLNGNELSYKDYENPNLTTHWDNEEYRYASYDYEAESYVIPVDCGVPYRTAVNPALIVPEYVTNLGGQYEIVDPGKKAKTMDLESRWTIGDHTWVMKGRYQESEDPLANRIHRVKVYRDGKPLDIQPHNVASNTSMIALTLEDFGKLFDVSYEVDETTGSIYFHFKME